MTAYWDNIGKPAAITSALFDSLIAASKTNHLTEWLDGPFLRGIRNISRTTPPFTQMLVRFAKDPFIWAPQGHKALAAYLVLESTQCGSETEGAAIALFTDRLITSIEKNTATGSPNNPLYFLFSSAARINGMQSAYPMSDAESERRGKMIKALPTVIDKVAEGDAPLGIGCAVQALQDSSIPDNTKRSLLGVIFKRSLKVANANHETPEPLMKTLLKIERASSLLNKTIDAEMHKRLGHAWHTVLNALYLFDPALAVDWVENLCSQPKNSIHSSIKDIALNVAATYDKPHPPTGVVSRRVSHTNAATLEANTLT